MFSGLQFCAASVTLTDTRAAHEPRSQMISIHVSVKSVTFCRSLQRGERVTARMSGSGPVWRNGAPRSLISVDLITRMDVQDRDLFQTGSGSVRNSCNSYSIINTIRLFPTLVHNSFLRFAFQAFPRVVMWCTSFGFVYYFSKIVFRSFPAFHLCQSGSLRASHILTSLEYLALDLRLRLEN